MRRDNLRFLDQGARLTTAAITALFFCCLPARGGSIIINGGFDTVGPDGSSTTTIGINDVPSAAAAWNTIAFVPNGVVTTTLLPTTDPNGSLSMIHIQTDSGRFGDHGSGLVQSFTPVPSAVASFDILVVSGQVTGGLVLQSGPFANFQTFGPTDGQWIHVTDIANAPVQGIAFETLSLDGAGADYYIENVTVETAAAPEPSTLLLALLGAGTFAASYVRESIKRKKGTLSDTGSVCNPSVNRSN